jgi:uroporphyrinogen-III synthase
MRRLVVTGPIGRAEEYAAAARDAGWEATVRELLEIRPRELAPGEVPAEVGIVCVTSKHAIAALPPVNAPVAVVGEGTASRLRERGLSIAVGPARSASELASEIAARFPAGTSVLWPRGSLSDDLARDLRGRGFEVADPVAYETLVTDAELPEADAVFLASPSAVCAAAERGRGFALAIAIGATTASELATRGDALGEVHVLDSPTPDSLAACLRGLATAT